MTAAGARRGGKSSPGAVLGWHHVVANACGRCGTDWIDGRGRVQIADAYWEVTGPDLPPGAHVRIVGGDAMTLQVEQA